jgi:transcription initiation factor TFIIB
MKVNLKSGNQTQKIKKSNSKVTNALWDKFDVMIGDKDDINLECLYTKQTVGCRTHCDICKFAVAYEERFLTCTNTKCGIIYKDQLDESAEWRYYGADDSHQNDPTRCGMPINPLLKESSYGCKVICPGNSSYEMRKIRRYTEWQSMPYKEKSQYDEFQRIQILSKHAGIPKIIIDEALRYHKKISEMKTFRGCNRDGVIAASIYIASRIHNYPRTAKEIATIFKLENTDATKGCKNAVHLVNQIEKNMVNADKTHFHKTTPVSFIERYCSKLGINHELTTVCLFVAKRIQRANKIPENTPHSVAAGIIYFVAQKCKLNISKRAVNNISEISEVTINKCYKKLNNIHMEEKLIPLCILSKYSD